MAWRFPAFMAGSIFKNLDRGSYGTTLRLIVDRNRKTQTSWCMDKSFRSSVFQAGTTLVGHVHRISSFLRGLWSTSQPWQILAMHGPLPSKTLKKWGITTKRSCAWWSFLQPQTDRLTPTNKTKHPVADPIFFGSLTVEPPLASAGSTWILVS